MHKRVGFSAADRIVCLDGCAQGYSSKFADYCSTNSLAERTTFFVQDTSHPLSCENVTTMGQGHLVATLGRVRIAHNCRNRNCKQPPTIVRDNALSIVGETDNLIRREIFSDVFPR